MQLIMTMRCPEKLCLPFNYNHQLQSAIYAKLKETGYSDFLHDGGYFSSHRYKAFVFGSLCGKHIVADGHFLFEDRVKLEVRSPVFAFCDALQQSLENDSRIRLFDSILPISDLALGNRHFCDGEYTFAANSPVCVYRTEKNGSTTYFAPPDDACVRYLLLNYRNKYAAIVGEEPPELSISPLPHQRKIVTNFKGTWINGFKGKYVISGSGKGITFLYNAGLGAKNSQGFGLLDAEKT